MTTQTSPNQPAEPAPSRALSDDQLIELLRLIKGADTVELKLSVPDANQRSTVAALGMDPLESHIRQVFFFDTPALDLNNHGVVLRARRIQARPGDSVVKLRPVDPENLTPEQRQAPGFGVEVDAMPGGFVCSASLKGEQPDAKIREIASGGRPLSKLFTKQQRALYEANAPAGISIDDLSVLGPINVLKLKFTPPDFDRRLVAELWLYPDGTRILELSTKCPTADTFNTAAVVRGYLASHGVDLAAAQQTKTKTALEFFSRELSSP
ncbi:hypothetical protein [Intrasporangium sp. YIM S08009]|uniref:hypothetical protein n=1 Tax=Intrasporangium zincisolvens TaxID=3080018 RepID=UPI002B05ACBD|nr:hypothetical protein [Intrasporangium sp. YIM S08009]